MKNVENIGATELIKDEAKITLKNGNKGQKKVLTKIEKFCWEKMNETKLTCFNFVVEKGKITLVTLVWLEKP